MPNIPRGIEEKVKIVCLLFTSDVTSKLTIVWPIVTNWHQRKESCEDRAPKGQNDN